MCKKIHWLIWKHWSLLFWGDLYVDVFIHLIFIFGTKPMVTVWYLSTTEYTCPFTHLLHWYGAGSEYVYFSATKTEMSSNNYSFQKPMKNVTALNRTTVTLIYTDTLHHTNSDQISAEPIQKSASIFFHPFLHCIFVWT